MKTVITNGLLRVAALIAVPAGALGSLGFMFRVGQRNQSVLLAVLFAGWVLLPFVGLVWAYLASKRWTASAQTMLHWLMLIIALGSLLIYGNVALGPPRPQPARFFLLVPLASWVLIALVAAIGAKKARPEVE